MLARCVAAAAFLLASPAAVRADVPGAPPAVRPQCPPGTHLEGPYRYWSCVPDEPPSEAPVLDAPTPRPRDAPRAPDAPTTRDTPPEPEPATDEPTDTEAERPEPIPTVAPPADEPVAPAAGDEPDLDEEPRAGCACRATPRTDRAPLVGGLLIVGLGWARRRRRR